MKASVLSLVMAYSAASLSAQSEAIYVQQSDGSVKEFPVASIVKISMDGESMKVETTSGVSSFAVNDVTNVTTSPVDPRVVNLGLSVDWAVCNLGAQAATDLGDRYSWGETAPKTSFPIGGTLYEKSFSTLKGMGAVDAAGNLTAKYDAATAVMGTGWRMPTRDEITELKENCTSEWTQVDGVWGQLVTGPNGAKLFLAARGQSYQGQEEGEGEYGMFWSSTVEQTSIVASYTLGVEWRRVNWGINNRYVGLPVRPVKEKNVGSTADDPSGNVNPRVTVLYCLVGSSAAPQGGAMAIGADADCAVYRGIVPLSGQFQLTATTSEGTLKYGGSNNHLKLDGPAINSGFSTPTLCFFSCNMNDFSYQTPVKIEKLGVCGSMTGWSGDVEMTPSADGLVYTVQMSMNQGEEFKIRANGAWNGINFGGTLVNGEAVVDAQQGDGRMWWDGSNFKAPRTGQLTVTLDLSAYPYKVTVK